MLMRWPPSRPPAFLMRLNSSLRSIWLLGMLCVVAATVADAMTPKRITELRQETVDMFYHGFDNYMQIAFPEDELRPISCLPLTRDQHNPRNVELNDVLGNYSLTLIDSLSTLAILASSSDKAGTGAKAVREFQDGIAALVIQYGDGTEGASGQGLRGRGFDVDSKVQVFETVIRGVGGLLSAHLFAVGELPISGYKPVRAARKLWKAPDREINPPIVWPNGFRYDGQLLRLALDLAQRLLPAFYTNTGMPYPRVNLRHGVPFYLNSPLNNNSAPGEQAPEHLNEITETCSAGAGSLVLEFTVLSRLTGDPRFEQLAKRAFWAVWNRRSHIGLIGAGVDAEAGHWVGPYSGIGAGADSFFEYALKTHILLSGHDNPNVTTPRANSQRSTWLDPNTIYRPLSEEENSPDTFLRAWQDAHSAIKRHLYSNTHHPHYVNVHLSTGSPQAYWIDSLGAYYPGLLTLAGELDEAIETSLLYTALWTRYEALPERWSVRDGTVEGGLGWWPGRPEFVESNYHLYRATKDPWYLYVGEMVLQDIKRRCWTKCGWAGLQDVRTGEKTDRMESFFLGETAKYLYLLFDPDHPLNSLDAPFVFTTEGHPLIIPRNRAPSTLRRKKTTSKAVGAYVPLQEDDTCPLPPPLVPLTVSATAARFDLFHAASLTGLQDIPNNHALIDIPTSVTGSSSRADTSPVPNHTFYPRTLPLNLVPSNATCAKLPLKTTFNIEFPSNAQLPAVQGFNVMLGPQALVRINNEGILIKSLQGVKLGLVEEDVVAFTDQNERVAHAEWRITSIGNMALGRDEKVFVQRDVIGPMVDPSFTRIRDAVLLDLVLQIPNPVQANTSTVVDPEEAIPADTIRVDHSRPHYEEAALRSGSSSSSGMAEYKTMLNSLLHHVTSVLRDPTTTHLPQPEEPISYHLQLLEAVTPTGVGAAPVPDVAEVMEPTNPAAIEPLMWTKFFFAGEACGAKLPEEAVRAFHVIVMKRGGCTFSEKLANIPAYTPSTRGFQLLVMVNYGNWDNDGEPESAEDDAHGPIRPLLGEMQRTPAGLLRHHLVPMVLVDGGEEAENLLKQAKSMGLRRRYHIESQGLVINNLVVV